MPPPPPLLYPTAELVATYWLRPLLSCTVDPILPPRDAAFASHGHLQVTAAGGAPDRDTGQQDSLLQLDAWAYQPGARQPPWYQAAQILGAVKQIVDGQMVSQPVVATPAEYRDARLMSAVVNVDPQRLEDSGGMARVQMLLHLWWVPLATSSTGGAP